MLLQRLIADDKIGFSYDYMGYAEFEFGVTRKSRLQLAKLQIEKKISARAVRFFERHHRMVYGPTDVYVFGAEESMLGLGLTKIPGTDTYHDLMIGTEKSSAEIENTRILGWMSVQMVSPILIIRATEENIERGNKFLQQFMTEFLNEEDAATKQTLHSFQNGFTIAREHGDVILPQNDGIAIPGGGQWVLRDSNNIALDRDKYFNDITERNKRRIGDEIPTEN